RLEQLPVATLDRALALAEMDHVAVAVAEHLDLDMARLLDVPLDVHGGVAEGRARLRARRAEGAGQLAGSADEPHPLAAAAHGRLDHDRVPHLAGDAGGLGVVAERPL